MYLAIVADVSLMIMAPPPRLVAVFPSNTTPLWAEEDNRYELASTLRDNEPSLIASDVSNRLALPVHREVGGRQYGDSPTIISRIINK